MNTSKSLLEKAKLGPESEAWFHLHRIYDPLIAGWVSRAGVQHCDITDITQEVLATVAQELPSFEHNGRVGAFRNWLKLITVNRCRRYWDKKKKQLPTLSSDGMEYGYHLLSELEDQRSEASALWNREHDNYVLNKLIEFLRDEFDDESVEVFVRAALKEESAKSISEAVGLSVPRIYKIRYKVMKRLRLVAKGLLDDMGTDDSE